ncbi:PD-(D/E)XK nuclease family transposase [Candidatus Merdisoma sp. JLR.KK006]|jgi:predicted HTH domain antitoxin|uniref:PD-(D/E)XK nuclease family transposase n=1 Tax=Candidatus Merdisoma sp. JLR.KK006 TaxID=3112626 RepID=UPI002FF237C4
MEIRKRKGKQVGRLTVTEQIDQKHQEDLQRLRGFRLLDDDFLTKCFEGDTASIELVLQIVLEKPDLKVLDVRTQVFVENLLNRSVRFDILATDSTGAKINVEIQRADKGAGRKRARYNSSMMDATLLKKGDDFDNLPETWVVFITENDVIGKGLPLYPVERCFLGTGERFEDGSHILYVNGAYRGDTPIGKLMHDFSCTNAADMYYTTLADRVRFFKESKEGILIMCKVMEDMRKESLQEGIKEGAINTAKRMLTDGILTLEKIAEYAGLPLDEVKKLKAERTA